MKAIFCFICLFANTIIVAQKVGIGTASPDPSAKLDITSINSGFLAPRMTSAQRDLIPSPALGLMIVNTTTNSVEFFDGTSWQNISSAIRSASRVRMLIGGTSADEALDIQATADGGFILIGQVFMSAGATGSFAGLMTYGTTDIYIARFDSFGNMLWQRFYGGSGSDFGKSIQQTTDGGFIVNAYYGSSNSGTITGMNTNGGSDFLVMKLDSNGNIMWQKLLGGASSDEAYSIRQTTDGGYIAGGISTSSNTGTLTGLTNNGNFDYLVIKLDATGTLQWQKMLGGSLRDDYKELRQVTDGGYILAGYSASSNTGTMAGLNTNGNEDYWIVKLDGSGNTSWQKLLGGSANDEANSVQATSDGGCVVSGSSLSSNTGTLTGFTSNGLTDYWILKLDVSGNVQWQKLYGGANDDYCYKIQLTADGGSIVTGTNNSSNTGNLTGLVNSGLFDVWTLKLDATGNIQWQKLFGETASDGPAAIRILNDGSYILAGSTASSNSGIFSGLFNYSTSGLNDIFILRLDRNGNLY